jgi:phosphatidylglycerophosphate synthase
MPSPRPPTWKTWANLLTTIRLLLLIPTVVAILIQSWLIASILFALAVITDVYDGKLARKLNQTSPFGGLFDHATDALYVTLCCWALAETGLINPLLNWLIPLAFVQYMLDSKALAGVALRMSVIGKSNGVAYYGIVGTVVGSQLLGWQFLQTPILLASWLLVVTTVLSMLDRAVSLLRHRKNTG